LETKLPTYRRFNRSAIDDSRLNGGGFNFNDSRQVKSIAFAISAVALAYFLIDEYTARINKRGLTTRAPCDTQGVLRQTWIMNDPGIKLFVQKGFR
jgi:hypothetical protein